MEIAKTNIGTLKLLMDASRLIFNGAGIGILVEVSLLDQRRKHQLSLNSVRKIYPAADPLHESGIS